MNTIEQAREASMRLKRYGYDDLALLSISTIDALIAELNDEHMRCAQADNAVEQLAAELVRYKANATILQELHDQDMVELSAMTAERDALRADVHALLRQIDIGDFLDRHGHSAKMLSAVHDLLGRKA